MATAELPPTRERTANAPPTPQAELWEGKKISYIRGSGEIGTGKSIFGLTIDQNTRRHNIEPTTLVWDLEGSCDTYKDQLNFEHRDLSEMVQRKSGGKNYSQKDLFIAWRDDMLAIEPGKYRVGIVDTFSDIESGLIEWVRSNPSHFGRSASQYANASTMFLWPDIKTYAKQIIYGEVRKRFETFYTAHHLKNEWSSGRKTGNRMAEGLDILEKLASVHLLFSRSPEKKGGPTPRVPHAIQLKERLIEFGENESGDDDRPILPPRLPKATPHAIREYIKNPPDYGNLKPEEMQPDDSLTSDQVLLINQDIAQKNAETAKSQVDQAELMKNAAEMAGVSYQTSPLAGPTVTTPTPQAPSAIARGTVTDSQLARLKDLVHSHGTVDGFTKKFLAPLDFTSPKQLGTEQAKSITETIVAMVEAKLKAASPIPTIPPAGEPGTAPHNPQHAATAEWAKRYGEERELMKLEKGGLATAGQLTRLKKLVEILPVPQEELIKLPKEFGKNTFPQLTIDEIDVVIGKLLDIHIMRGNTAEAFYAVFGGPAAASGPAGEGGSEATSPAPKNLSGLPY